MFAHRDWDTGLLGVNRHPQWYDDWNDSRNSQARAFTEAGTKDYLNQFSKEIHQ
jgi:hypothetical protein